MQAREDSKGVEACGAAACNATHTHSLQCLHPSTIVGAAFCDINLSAWEHKKLGTEERDILQARCLPACKAIGLRGLLGIFVVVS
jgi:hypothetical protein